MPNWPGSWSVTALSTRSRRRPSNGFWRTTSSNPGVIICGCPPRSHVMQPLRPRCTTLSPSIRAPWGCGKWCCAWTRKPVVQPRTRKAPTLAAQPGIPVRVEHEYIRKGALNLFAGFDTRGGTVYATTASRKRQVEFITFWSIWTVRLCRRSPRCILCSTMCACTKGSTCKPG